MMPNISNLINEPPPGPPPPLHQSHNNLTPPKSENQIPGLDLATNNENSSKGFLNVSRILPQNQIRPIQTPDDKPFNFPKSIMNLSTLNSHPINTSHDKMNQPPLPMYQSSSNWSKFNNPGAYHNQLPPDVDNSSISSFGQQTDVDSRLPYDGDKPNLNITVHKMYLVLIIEDHYWKNLILNYQMKLVYCVISPQMINHIIEILIHHQVTSTVITKQKEMSLILIILIDYQKNLTLLINNQNHV